jgi:Fe-S cluster assembly scaffold protein SufB
MLVTWKRRKWNACVKYLQNNGWKVQHFDKPFEDDTYYALYTNVHFVTHRVRFLWKAQTMKAVQGNIGCLLQKSYTAYTLCGKNVEFLVLNLMVYKVNYMALND